MIFSIKLFLYFSIGISLSVALEDNDEKHQFFDLINDNRCLTDDGKLGVCGPRESCPKGNSSQITYCSDGQTICCTQTKNGSKNETFLRPFRAEEACGIRPNNRDFGFIVGGHEADPHTWPWAVGVYRNSQFICGATIIDQKRILCAAHCVKSSNGQTYSASSFSLRVGAHNLKTSGKTVYVSKVTAHRSYDPYRMQNDIAIFHLKDPLNFALRDSHISPICLMDPTLAKQNFARTMATVCGWGTTRAGGLPTDTLRQVEVPIMTNAECKMAYKENENIIQPLQICAGYV